MKHGSLIGYFSILIISSACSADKTEYDFYNSDEHAIYVNADQQSLEFSAEEHFSELRFDANFWWALDMRLEVAIDDYEQSGWFSVTPTENFGSRPVMVSLSRNIEKHPRQVQLSFRDKNSSEVVRTLTITQQASEPFIELNEIYKDFSVLGGSIDVEVTTSEIWTVSAPEWCRITGIDGGGKGKHMTVSFEIPLYSGADREGEIRFFSVEDDVAAVYTVKQAGTFVSPIPTVTNGEEFVVAWEKPYGAQFFHVNFYASDGTGPIATITYVPNAEETECRLTVDEVDWNGYVGPVEVRVETFLSDEVCRESEPQAIFNHNLFDNASGNGESEDSPCIIANTRHFRNIARSLAVPLYYKQTADIDLSGFRNNSYEPIGSGTYAGRKPFTGHYDGGGNRICNLEYAPDNKQNVEPVGDGCLFTSGIFGYVQGEKARIANVVLDNVAMSNEKYGTAMTNSYMASVGLLVGTLDGGSIENCVVRNSRYSMVQKIATTNDNFVFGGVAGRIIGASRVEYCTVETLTLDQRKGGRIGGVVGWAPRTNDDNTSRIFGCMNLDGGIPEPETVNVTPISGGIVAILCSNSSVVGCTNYARVKTGMESGGIVGRMENNSVMEACVNYGRVSGICNANKAFIGGLAGNVLRKVNELTTVRRSFNAGEIENRCDDKGTNMQFLGGIAGNNQGILEDCYSVGKILVTTQSGAKGAKVFAGGISGVTGNDPKVVVVADVRRCYNAGTVEGLASMNTGIVAGSIDVLSAGSTIVFEGVYGDAAYAPNPIGNSDMTPQGVSALTASQLKIQSNFPGWNFSQIWNIRSDVNNGYPSLIDVPVVVK